MFLTILRRQIWTYYRVNSTPIWEKSYKFISRLFLDKYKILSRENKSRQSLQKHNFLKNDISHLFMHKFIWKQKFCGKKFQLDTQFNFGICEYFRLYKISETSWRIIVLKTVIFPVNLRLLSNNGEVPTTYWSPQANIKHNLWM